MKNPFYPVAEFPDFPAMTPDAADEALPRLLADAKALDDEICRDMAEGRRMHRMEAIRTHMAQWDARLSAARISPGGCADLLALTLLAHFMN